LKKEDRRFVGRRLEAGAAVRTTGPPIWDRLSDVATAWTGVENLLLAAAESLPKAVSAPAGRMAMLGEVGDEWPAPFSDVVKTVRADMPGRFRSRLDAAVADGELPLS